ncbi:MAG: hypothetical protein IJU49_07900 [Lachnospiraceae bacterium]|nr:hypothetical protein [Lachnospiraceae bacterium]MBQ7602066.1 hypothetical protein [Lachnospiraceae bacterium]
MMKSGTFRPEMPRMIPARIDRIDGFRKLFGETCPPDVSTGNATACTQMDSGMAKIIMSRSTSCPKEFRTSGYPK